MKLFVVWTADIHDPDKCPVIYIGRTYESASKARDNANKVSKFSYDITYDITEETLGNV